MSQDHDTYLRFQDVFVPPYTFEQFEVELRSLGLGLVLRIFAAINVICSKRGPPRGQGTQVGLIRELFAPATAKLVEGHSLTVFHRLNSI